MSNPQIGYPVCPVTEARRLGDKYQAIIESSSIPAHSLAAVPNSEEFWKRRTIGNVNFDWELLDDIVSRFDAECVGLKIDERQEVFVSTAWEIIDKFPTVVVQDLDFWRYLALFPFRNFVYSINKRMAPGDYGGFDSSIDRWELIEGARWAFRLADGPNDDYISKIADASEAAGRSRKVRDSYISNVVRPNWARPKPAARAFIDAALETPALLDEGKGGDRRMNDFQQKVAQLQNNVLFVYLDQDEAKETFSVLRS